MSDKHKQIADEAFQKFANLLGDNPSEQESSTPTQAAEVTVPAEEVAEPVKKKAPKPATTSRKNKKKKVTKQGESFLFKVTIDKDLYLQFMKAGANLALEKGWTVKVATQCTEVALMDFIRKYGDK